MNEEFEKAQIIDDIKWHHDEIKKLQIVLAHLTKKGGVDEDGRSAVSFVKFRKIEKPVHKTELKHKRDGHSPRDGDGPSRLDGRGNTGLNDPRGEGERQN